MKKCLQIICLLFVILLPLASISLLRILPADAPSYVEKKYTGWNGVLQAWICSSWNAGGSFVRWLNASAQTFEKDHEGVYLEFTPVETTQLARLLSEGHLLPDILLFSPDVLSDASSLMKIRASTPVRDDLYNCGGEYALPVAMGGYVWAWNTALCTEPPMDVSQIDVLVLPPDKDGCSISTSLIGLISNDGSFAKPEVAQPDAGIDLGLPALAQVKIIHAEDALDQFINGELPYLPVTQKEIARLAQLRESGRGPEWSLAATGRFAYTDQLLMGGIVNRHGTDEAERQALCLDFLHFLLSDESQNALADIGACSINGRMIHTGFSPYAPLDALLNSRRLYVPNCFSEYSSADSSTIVHNYLNGKISAKDVLIQMGFEVM